MSAQLIVCGDYNATLKRFLDARKGSLDAALKMLADSIAWRHLSGADHALSRPLDPSIRALAREVRPSSYIGFDDHNRPIFYERVGFINHQVLERSGLTDEEMCVLLFYLPSPRAPPFSVFPHPGARARYSLSRIPSTPAAASCPC